MRWRLVGDGWILGELWGMHHERRRVVPHVTCWQRRAGIKNSVQFSEKFSFLSSLLRPTGVVRVLLGGPRGGLLLLLLDDLLCFVGGHGYLVLRSLGLSGQAGRLLVAELRLRLLLGRRLRLLLLLSVLHVSARVEWHLLGRSLMGWRGLSEGLHGELGRGQRALSRELRLSLDRLEEGAGA